MLAAAGPASAHLFEGTVNMTVAAEVPAPTGTSATTSGVATFELEDDLTLKYEVQVTDLTGPPTAAHIHEGAPGVPGGIIISLTVKPDGTISGTTETALTAEQVSKLQSGAYYVNVHTDMNQAGEIRGQIHLTAVKGTCSCQTLSRHDFKKCVNGEIKKLDKTQKKSAEVKALKKAVAKSACGLPKTPKKKPQACCLPANDVASIVTGELCAPVKKDTQCTKLGGTLIATSGCLPNPCSPPASPSGAFID
jgi:hypothetical protein